MNGDKTDMDDKECQKKDQESSNNDLGKKEYNKHPGVEREQHTVRN
jgi:hypothetical protein